MSRRNRYNDYGGFAPYVPVAQRRAKAKREMQKLRKQGHPIEPVEIEGRTIARSFWGKAWCSHLEAFGDYANRLPRGRTYARNGSVCHLGITTGSVDAYVSGSELYKVKVDITPLPKRKWGRIKTECTGGIGSLIELLQGKLSDAVMSTVTNSQQGLFPLRSDISYTCSCPDGAHMCKHIAAVMYGIGARLDSQPELLFLLRGVDHAELISADASVGAITGKRTGRARRRTLDDGALENVFGIELEDQDTQASASPVPRRPRKTKSRSAAHPAQKTANARRTPFTPTSAKVIALRKRLGLSRAALARDLGVSAQTVANWERANGPFRPQARCLAALEQHHAR